MPAPGSLTLTRATAVPHAHHLAGSLQRQNFEGSISQSLATFNGTVPQHVAGKNRNAKK